MLGSDELRLSIARAGGAQELESPPLEIVPDLIAGALARRDLNERFDCWKVRKIAARSAFGEAFLLTYLYCLNGNVDKAEALAAANCRIDQQRFVRPIGCGKNCKPISDSIRRSRNR